MICAKCGNKVDDTNSFCPMCGAKLESGGKESTKPEKKAAKVNKKIVIAAVTVVCLIGAFASIFKYNSLPSTKYKRAEVAFASEEYEKALKLYKAAGTYQDARQKAGQAQVCIHYEQGKAYMRQAQYDAAISEFSAINSYEDASQLIRQCHYENGLALLDSSQYEEAAEEFAASNKYEDAEAKIIEMGEALTEKAEYKLAVSVFEKTSSSKNNKYLDYSEASIRYQEKKYADAANLYRAAGKVLNSEEKYKECEYEAGMSDLKNASYSSAKNRFKRITDYKDSENLIMACDLLNARGCINEGKMNTAKGALDKLPEDYEYKEVSVSALKERIDVCEKWMSVSGKWTSTGGKIESRDDNSFQDHWWYVDFEEGNVDIIVTCVPREDGSAKVTVNGQIPIFTNYSIWKEYLNTEAKNISITKVMNDFGTITVDSNTTVTISDGSISVNYKYVDNNSAYSNYIYSTDVKCGKRVAIY